MVQTSYSQDTECGTVHNQVVATYTMEDIQARMAEFHRRSHRLEGDITAPDLAKRGWTRQEQRNFLASLKGWSRRPITDDGRAVMAYNPDPSLGEVVE